MKTNLRSTAEEDPPHIVLLSACIEQCITVCCVSCLGVVRSLSVSRSGTRGLPLV